MVVHAQRGQEELLMGNLVMTNSATNTANFDTFGASYATIRVTLQSEINTNGIGPTISLLSSDDTVVTNFATIVANRTTEVFVLAKQVVYHVDCRSEKRYLRLSVTTGATTNDDVTVNATGTLSRLSEEPAGALDMANSTNTVVVLV